MAGQPTRQDVDRNVKKFIFVHDVMTDVTGALKANDLAAVAELIGDPAIEANKKNLNLGLTIPFLQRAKPYMYGYAQLFSKKQDSPLTIDLKKAADDFYATIAAARERALAGDGDGTKANFAAATAALTAYADAIEAETLKGRLNSVKVRARQGVGDYTHLGLMGGVGLPQEANPSPVAFAGANHERA